MELSINTLVVLILGIIIIGGGVAFVGSIIAETEKLLPAIGEAAEREMAEKLAQGERVVITDNAKQGSYGDYTFGLGFKNSFSQERSFRVEIIPKSIIERDGDVLSADNMPEPFYVEEEIHLQPGEKDTNTIFNIDIEKGLPRGTYTYEVQVLYNETDSSFGSYANPQLVMITIQ